MEEIDNGRDLHLLKADLEKVYGAGSEDVRKVSDGAEPEDAQSVKDSAQECGLPGVSVETFHELGHEMRILKVPGRRLADSIDGEELYKEYVPGADTASAEEPVTMTFVPYYAWNNRGEGEMTVWVRA